MQTPANNRNVAGRSSGGQAAGFTPAVRLRGFTPAWLVLLAGVVISIFAGFHTKSELDRTAGMECELIANEVTGKIRDRLDAHENVLRSAAAFCEQTPDVTREKWRYFAERQNSHPQRSDIHNLGFSLLIPRKELPAHLARIRAEGFPDYKVWPESDRPVYSSIIYLEPFNTRNQLAFGYDMFTEPVRRAAMEKARDRDAAILSGKVTLVQENGHDVQAGTLMYLPVYRQDLPRQTVEQRRQALAGWVYSPYRMNDLLNGILGEWDLTGNPSIRLEIFDGDRNQADALLYRSRRLEPAETQSTQAGLTIRRELETHGRKWSLYFSRPFAGLGAAAYGKAWLVTLGGITISLLLGGLVLSLASTRERARAIAERLTADLRLANARLKLATEAGGVGIWEYSPGTEKLVWDDQMFHLYGVERSDFSGSYRDWKERVHPDDRERGDREIQDALIGGRDFNTEFRIIRSDGGIRHIRGMGVVRRDAAGNPEHLIGTNWDISDRKQTEEILSRQTALLTNLLNSIPDIVFFKDLNGAYLGCNPPFAEFVGKPREEIIGRTDQELFEPALAGDFVRHDHKVMAEGVPSRREETIVYPDGRQEAIDTFKAPLATPEGEIIGLLGISRIITARKLAELQQAHNREFEHLVATLANQFINAAAGNIDRLINDTLQNIGKFVGADRSYIFEFYDNRRIMSNTYEWTAPGIAPQMEMLQQLPFDSFPWLMARIHNEPIIIPRVADLPEEARVEREILEAQHIQSLVMIPLSSGSAPLGFIGFDAVRRERDWSEETASILKLAGGIITSVLLRKRSEHLIQSELDLSLQLNSSRSLQDTLDICLHAALKISEMDCGSIHLVDSGEKGMVLAHHHGLPEAYIEEIEVFPPDSPRYQLVMQGNAIFSRFEDMKMFASPHIENEGLKAIALLPVVYQGNVVACLNVASHKLEQVPDFARISLETVAPHIASAIVHARHEQEISTANKNLQSLFDTIDDLLFIIDRSGRILYSNPAAQRRLGYRADELNGLEVLKTHPPDRQEEAKEVLEKMISGARNLCNVPLMTKSGEEIPVETIITYGEWNDRPVLFGLCRDISERLRSEAALTESEKRFRALTEMLPMPVVEFDANGRLLYCNRQGLARFGRDAAEIAAGLPAEQLFAARDAVQIRRKIETILTGGSEIGECLGRCKCGEEFPGLLYASPIVKENHVCGGLGIFIDLTELKQAEAARRENALQKRVSQNLKSIIDNIPGTVYRISVDGTMSIFGSASIKPGKVSPSSQPGAHAEMPTIHPEDQEMVARSNQSLRQARGAQLLVYRVFDDDRNIRWVEDRRSSIFDENGAYFGIDGVMLDVTDRVRAEEEKNQLEISIRNRQRLETIGTLAGGIAHDFNNILVPVLGYAELGLTAAAPGDPFHDYFEQIIKAAERARNLVSQILTFSRPEESNPVPVSLQLLLKESFRLLRPSIPSTIQIKLKVDASCRNVLADPSQIHQVIANLCTNAFHAMEGDGGTLTVELGEIRDPKELPAGCDPAAEYLALRVSDTGVGMDQATLEHIYEPFFTTKPVNKGTGLGLSVVYGIVKSCKGEITVTSHPGQGSVFSVFLPVIDAAVAARTPERPSACGGGRILLVDDEPASVKVLSLMLTKLGYAVEATTSATQLLALFKQNPADVDLVITDLTMPAMTGVELARAIRQVRPDTPIVLITGYGKDLDRQLPDADCGFRQILKKPVQINVLAETVSNIIKERKKHENSGH